MRQVPSYLVIGQGRMAKHFCYYLSLLNLPFTQWARRRQPLEELYPLIIKASHIIVLINDSQLDSFISSLNPAQYPEKKFIHFSGRVSLNNAYSAHPLMTFTENLYEESLYLSVPFILEENSLPFADLLPGLSNQSYFITSQLKSYYHALIVMGNNFSCLLWQHTFQELSRCFNLPQSVALPILRQTFKNIADNPNAALTGPLVRKDTETMSAHLKALENDKFFEIYQAFMNTFQ